MYQDNFTTENNIAEALINQFGQQVLYKEKSTGNEYPEVAVKCPDENNIETYDMQRTYLFSFFGGVIKKPGDTLLFNNIRYLVVNVSQKNEGIWTLRCTTDHYPAYKP